MGLVLEEPVVEQMIAMAVLSEHLSRKSSADSAGVVHQPASVEGLDG